MKICLISPPVTMQPGREAISRKAPSQHPADPALGILSLAALLEDRGANARILDVNSLLVDTAEPGGTESYANFLARASAELEDIEADVFGFGTLTGSYPLTIRLAAEVKRAHPGAVVVFGGPQASALDIETLKAFEFIDFVVRGEADQTFPQLLDVLANAGSLSELPGITYHGNNGPVQTEDAPIIANLDTLPVPAFHLWPGIKDCRQISIEAGRGCPYACTFCSTGPFFRRRYRIKDPCLLVRQMTEIRQSYGISSFHLVHDNFTAGRDKVIAFCDELLHFRAPFDWTCSARTDCVDEELLKVMEKSGCKGIFFGIESGSPRMQRSIGKNLDLEQAREVIRQAESCRICNTVSLITGFPDETPDDLRGTVNFFVESMRFERVAGQLHLLAAEAGSPLHNRYRNKLVWDGIFSDLTLENWRQDPVNDALVREHPEVFPDFYAIPTRFLDRRYLAELRDFIAYGTARFRWLIIALHQYGGGLLEVFEKWRTWSVSQRPTGVMDADYYARPVFRGDFLGFVRANYLSDEDAGAIAVATLLEYEAGIGSLEESQIEAATTLDGENKAFADNQTIPCRALGVSLLHLNADYEAIIEHLKNGTSPRNVSRSPVVVAERRLPDGTVHVLQLSPLSSALLELCDGIHTIADIAEAFPYLQKGLDQLPKEEACFFALNELVRQGLLVASA